MSDYTWTPERLELCKKLWLAGDSASIVARTLGGVTRSAVIGKMNREGVKRPAQQPSRALAYPQRASAAKVERARGRGNSPGSRASLFIGHRKAPITPKALDLAGADIESPNAGPWIARQADQCAFPVGEVTGADQLSCCNPIAPDSGYCPAHTAMAYTPAAKLNTYGIPRDKRPQAAPRERFFSDWAAA